MSEEKKVIEIGPQEMLQIKNLAHTELLRGPIKETAKEDIRTHYLLSALARFIESKGGKPGFQVK